MKDKFFYTTKPQVFYNYQGVHFTWDSGILWNIKEVINYSK